MKKRILFLCCLAIAAISAVAGLRSVPQEAYAAPNKDITLGNITSSTYTTETISSVYTDYEGITWYVARENYVMIKSIVIYKVTEDVATGNQTFAKYSTSLESFSGYSNINTANITYAGNNQMWLHIGSNLYKFSRNVADGENINFIYGNAITIPSGGEVYDIVKASDDEDDSIFVSTGTRILWRFYDSSTQAIRYQEVPVGAGGNNGSFRKIDYDGKNIWITTSLNRVIRQSTLSPADYEVFTVPGTFAQFEDVNGISIDNNGDVWIGDNPDFLSSSPCRILRYRTKEKIWNQYLTNKYDFNGTILDVSISSLNRVYVASGKGLKNVNNGRFSSSSSNLLSTITGAIITGNTITYTTDERRVDFTAVVSPGASYALYADAACTSLLSGNRLNTPLAMGANTAQHQAWLKITAEDAEGYTIYAITVTRNKRNLILKPKDITITYGDQYVLSTELIGDLLDSDTVDQLFIKSIFYYDLPALLPVGTTTARISTFSYYANWDYTIQRQAGVVTVLPKDITVRLLPVSKTYGDADPVPSYEVTSGNLVYGDVVSSLVRTAGENAGDYAVNGIKISREGEDRTNYYNITVIESELTIDPLKIQVTGVDNISKVKTYDQTVSASTSGAILSTNILPGDTEVALAAWGSYNSKDCTNADRITLTFSFAGNSAKNSNYILPDDFILTGGVKIVPRELTIAGVTATRRVYLDENYTVTINGGVLDGVIGDDAVGFNLKGVGYINDSAAGKNKAVSTAIILTGTDKANYFLTQPDYVTVDIDPVTTEVFWEYNDVYIYNGQDQSATIRAYYFNLAGQRVYLATDINGSAVFCNKGIYTAQAFMITADGNYDIGTPVKDFEIFAFKVVVSSLVVNPQKTYDGTVGAVITNSGFDNIFDVSVKLSVTAVYNTSDVGADRIAVSFTLSGAGKENYEAPDDYTVTGAQVKINPFETEVIWTYELQYIYNNADRSATVTALCKSINNSDIPLAVSFAQGPFMSAGIHKASASLDNTNYRLTNSQVNITIEKRQIEVYNLTVTANKTYDGTVNAAINSDFSSNVLPGTAELIPSAKYNSKNVTEASYITVSFSLTGEGGDNYILPQSYTISSATIIALRISVRDYTVESVKSYDGLTAANITGNPTSDIVGGEVQIEIKAEFDDYVSGQRTVRVWFVLHNNDWGNYIAPFEYSITDGARITPKLVSVSWEKDERYIYNGQDRSESVKAYYEDIKGTKHYLQVSFAGSFLNAGSYIASVTLTDSTNYQLTDNEIDIVIEHLTVVLTDFTLSETKVFDGTTAAAVSADWTHNIADGDDAKLTVKAFYNSQNVNEATVITVRFYLEGINADNYAKPADYSIEGASITPLAVHTVWEHKDSYTYDKNNQSTSISAKYVDINGVDKVLAVEFNMPFINAGNYSAKASMVKADGNYTLEGEWKDFAIERLQITLQNLEITRQKTFDGGTTANIVEGYTTNIKDQATKIQINADYNTKGVTAESITVVFSFGNSAESNSNYILPIPIVLTDGVKISAKSLTISGVTATNREFNGTDEVMLTGGVLIGIIDNGQVSAILGTGRISNPNASYVPYTVMTDITLTGADKDNYILIQPTDGITVTISARIIEITWCADNFVYSGVDQRSSVTATYEDVLGNIVGLTVTSDSEFKLYNNSGYVFIASMRFDETNYLLPAVKTAVYRMQKATLTDTSADKTVEYDGAEHGITLSAAGFFGDDSISLGRVQYGTSPDYGHTDNILKINAGSYEIYYKIVFDNYETFTGIRKIIITPKKTDVLWTEQDFAYNGVDQSSKISAYIVSISANSIYLSISSDGIFKNAGEYIFTAVCRDSNYVLNNPTHKIRIAPLQVTVRISDLESNEGEPLKEPTCSVVSETGTISGGTIDIVLTKAPGLTAGYYPITGECSDANYLILWINGTYTIQQTSISSIETQGDKIINQITVESASGLSPDNKLSVTDLSEQYSKTGYSMSEGGKVTVKKVFNINIQNAENNTVPVNGIVSVKILISENLRHEKNLMVVYIDDNGKAMDMNAVREGDFLVFNTTHFSTYAIVSAAETTPGFLTVLLIALPLMALAATCFILIFIKIKRRKNKQKILAVATGEAGHSDIVNLSDNQ